MAVTKKLEIRTGQGFSRNRIRGIEKNLLVQVFSNHDRVRYPKDHAGGIALFHGGLHPVGPGVFKRHFEGDATIKMILAWVEFFRPFNRFTHKILVQVFVDDTVSDVGNIEGLPVQSFGIGLQVILDVREQFLYIKTFRLKGHLLAISEFVLQ